MRKAIQTVERKFKFIRYDPLFEDFYLYKGRIVGEQLCRKNQRELNTIFEYFDAPCDWRGATGAYLLQEHFPYSTPLIFRGTNDDAYQEAVQELHDYIETHQWFNRYITSEERDSIIEEAKRITSKYGHTILGFSTANPTQPARILKAFKLQIATGRHDGKHFKVIRIKDEGENLPLL